MARITATFVCSACGASYKKWVGQCDKCHQWDCINEEKPLATGPRGKTLGAQKGQKVILTDLTASDIAHTRLLCGIDEMDRALGGGLVEASAVLLGGDPGIGKSTLLLQMGAALANLGRKVVYISGEEAASQIKLRAARLGLSDAPLSLATETNLRDILTTLEAEAPDVAILDSIQTLWADHVDSAPGSVTQVRTVTHELANFAKRKGICVILVGHVTKDGQIAGPRVVEHIVDTVLYFEGERGHQFRILRAVKNRYGPADEIGVFEMTGKGLQQVHNPSELFLGERNSPNAGSVIFAGIEGSRPLLVEIQALVAQSHFATPRRAVVGWDSARLAMILAVLDARCQISFAGLDVYLNIAGGLRISETGADLAVAAALVSARENIPMPKDSVVFGEISLSGGLRAVGQNENRLKEAKKLGFSQAFTSSQVKTSGESGMSVHKNDTIAGFVDGCFEDINAPKDQQGGQNNTRQNNTGQRDR